MLVEASLRFSQVECGCSLKEDPASTGLGAALRDSDGVLVGIFARALDLDFAPSLAELLAIREALLWAKEHCSSNLIVESDCLHRP